MSALGCCSKKWLLLIGFGFIVFVRSFLMSDSNLVALAETAAYLIGLPKPIPEIIHEANLEATSLIAMYGYPAENHSITTIDGYILTHHRIPYGKNETVNNKTAIPVLIVHGMNSASLHAFDNGPVSLAFVLADNGYDVWLANLRSSSYSSHSTLTRQEQKFWDFSLEDIAENDIKPSIDYILEKTGFPKIHYIGISMGTSVSFFLLAQKPEYNQKIASVIALGPILFFKYSTFLLKPFVKFFEFQFLRNPLSIFVPSALTRKLMFIFCPSNNPIICEIFITLTNGYTPDAWNKTRIPVYLNHGLGGLPIKVMLHYKQMQLMTKLRKFDYGKLENIRRYGSVKPPEFNVSNIMAPTVLIHAANDVLATPLDVEIARQKLPNIVETLLLPTQMAGHIDVLFSTPLYKEIIDYLKRF